MKQLIKQVKRLGNSSGVVLPKEWENSLIKVEIVSKPLDQLELLNCLHNIYMYQLASLAAHYDSQ